MQLINRLNLIISKYHLLKHPFYQAWSKGELSIDILQKYAAQYYHQVKSFPCFVSRIHSRCPKIDARQLLLENLMDEEKPGKDHPGLWLKFGEGLGVTSEKMLNDYPEVETQAMVDKYYELADRDWRDGLCALYAYECQVPDVSTSKIEGLKKFYGIEEEKTLEFFTAHQAYDVEHAQQVAGLIERYVNPAYAEQATEEAAKVLWNFLDGMCRLGHITCVSDAQH